MKGLSIIALTALLAGPVHAGCAAPSNAVTIPDGATSILDELAEVVDRSIKRGGVMLIAAFAVGRAQQVT